MWGRLEQYVYLGISRDAPRGPESDFDLDLVTGALGVEPTTSFRVGDPWSHGRVYARAHWKLEVRGADDDDTEELLLTLLDRIGPLGHRLQTLRDQGFLTVIEIVVYMHSEGDVTPTPALAFAASTIARIAALSVDVDIDQYVL